MHGRRRTRESGVSTTGIALTLLLAILGLFAVAEAYAATQQILVPGNTWAPGQGFEDVTPCQGERCDQVPFKPGERFAFGQDVRNTGPLAITILGFPGVDNGLATIDAVEVAVDPNVPSTDPGATETFDTLTIQPGRERFLVFRGEFVGCNDVAAGAEEIAGLLEALPLRVRMLLIEHVRDVELGRPLRFLGPPRGLC